MAVIIGMDPHKRSATIEVIDDRGAVIGFGKFGTNQAGCTPDACPPMVGNVLVYMDYNHPSVTFMTTLSPIKESAVLPMLGW